MRIILKDPPSFAAFSSVGGKVESEGPLGKELDYVDIKNRFNQRTWEQSEAKMQDIALSLAMKKANLNDSDIDFLFAGDLINQCTSSGIGLVNYQISHVGIYGACSTGALGLGTSAIFLDNDQIKRCAVVTSSHFCSAERQFRYPLEYGSLRTPTSQHTVTGSAAFILDKGKGSPKITEVFLGQSVDSGIIDANNMGAAMAPAAALTLSKYFEASKTTPNDFDLIVSGDLGYEGYTIMREMMHKNGYNLSSNYDDCGLLIYDRIKQKMECGGSGCACSALVLATKILPQMKKGSLKNVLFMGTGALLSQASVQQGESIPGIAHLVRIQI